VLEEGLIQPKHHSAQTATGPQVSEFTDAERRQQFEAIYRATCEPLQRYLRRRTSFDDAEEALDDVLLVLWQKLPVLSQDDYLPWCYGVARRTLANRRRSQQRRIRLIDRITREAALPGAPNEVGLDDYPQLAGAFAQLPEPDREVLRLWAWEGLEAREIAIVMGITANAVSLRLSKAKKKLARLIGGQDPTGTGQKGDKNNGEYPS
jgi:RNA polymerase sigma-70 factor (ECF subfamily)